MRSWPKLSFAVVLLASASGAPASAQMFGANGGIASNIAMTNMMWQPHRQSVAGVVDRSVGVRAAGRSQLNASTVGRAATSYRASPAVTSQVKRQYVEFISKTVSPQAAAQYKSVLDRSDPVRNWGQLVASDGLRAGDAADSLAAYWMLNWMIANGEMQTNPAFGRAVAQQVKSTMASNPGFARLNEAQKQEMSEALMLNFLTQHAAYLESHKRNDAALRRKLGDAAVTRFRNEMGVDLRQLELTSSGFVKRG